MYVSEHARVQMRKRFEPLSVAVYTAMLEALCGEPGTVAYLLDKPVRMGVRSTVVAIAVDGSVDTVYIRRATQSIAPEAFGASHVVNVRTIIGSEVR